MLVVQKNKHIKKPHKYTFKNGEFYIKITHSKNVIITLNPALENREQRNKGKLYHRGCNQPKVEITTYKIK